MSKRFEGKVAIVMGAGTGMGEAVAHKLAREGAEVCIFGLPDDPVDDVVADINKQYGDVAVGFKGDGADELVVKAAVDQTIERFGRLDIACQTAGAFGPIADLTKYDITVFDELLHNNCRALFVFAKSTLPHVRKSHGCIVTIGSAAAVLGEPAAVPYGATKSFIHAFTIGWAGQESPYGVRVNSVAPGVIDTGWFDPDKGPLQPEMLKQLPGTNLMGRLGKPEEVANVVAFLASDDASYVTDAIWGVDGGLPITRGVAGEKASGKFRSAPEGVLTLRHSHDGSGKVASQVRKGVATMRTRILGNSGIEVSEIALGSWLTFSGGIERERTEACTRAAVDLGITFFDTANVYGQGTAESVWGDILSAYPRSDFVLATKLWGKMPDGQGLSPDQVSHQLDASLKRLRTDYVDVYYCHRFDRAIPVADTLGALTRQVEAGKVRAIGFSEWTSEQIKAALAIREVTRFCVSQPQYSMLWRAPEAELFPLASEHGISQAVWSPLGEGVLTGKYRPGEAPPANSRASSPAMSTFIGKFMSDRTLEAVQRLRPISDGLGITMVQLATAWVLRRPEVAAAIVGASRPEQLSEIVGASGVTLDDATCASIDQVLAPHAQHKPTLAVFAEPGLGASA